ncbi:PLD-like domain-containing protein [Blastococcus tunisiensis]|uniref:PLD-like domain-containing protein n=2 Tax=Blastococcus tunisiensis TaxID=1798228 RepID=A0A1I2B8S5_9ACTN|nr:PLD-like domain-containing protein [Blastococcus sp. DSM 46838]
MGAGVLARLAQLAKASSATWRVLTKLDAAAIAHGSLSTQGLRQLLAAGVELRSLSQLHAKVFLGDDAFGLIGSANLTDAGLGGTGGKSNVELGVLLDGTQQQEASKHFDGWWGSASIVTEADIDGVEKLAKNLPTSVSAPVVDAEPPQFLEEANRLLAEARSANLWIKAVYQDEAAADLAWGAGAWFSSSKRGRPSFQVGDLVLIYAKDAHRCSAVVEVTDSPRRDPAFVVSDGRPEEEGERWPWVNDVTVRLKVPSAVGVPLSHLGFTGQSLQGGHKRLGHSEFALAVRYLAATPAGDATS